MKRLIYAILIAFIFPLTSKGQGAIYLCEEQQVYGTCFNEHGYLRTVKLMRECAERKCKEAGGTACKLIYTEKGSGWFALIYGAQTDGRKVLMYVSGRDSKSEAEHDVKVKYIAEGGQVTSVTEIRSWEVKSNIKEDPNEW